jgi:hypothetical protein
MDGVSGLVAGRFSGRAVALMPSGSLIHTLADPVGTGTLGFAFRLNADDPTCALTVAFTAPSLADNFTVVLDAAGNVAVWAGSTQITASTTPAFSPYTWTYCGIQAIAGALESVIVHINGTAIINTSDFSTTPDQTNSIGSFGWQLSAAYATSSAYIDDVYFCDGTGPAPYNSFLGVCRLDTRYPTANGSHNSFTTSDPSLANWQIVSKRALDDTSYTTADVAGDQDTFITTRNFTSNDVVIAVEPQIAAQSPGNDGIVHTALIVAGVEYAGDDTALATQYAYVSEIYTLNPTTGVAWHGTDLNSIEFGYQDGGT